MPRFIPWPGRVPADPLMPFKFCLCSYLGEMLIEGSPLLASFYDSLVFETSLIYCRNPFAFFASIEFATMALRLPVGSFLGFPYARAFELLL